jgi:hypothetical protein
MNICNICQSGYKLKSNYDKHRLICETMYKSSNELSKETTDLPTLREIFAIVLEMNAKYSRIEKKIDELSKWVDSKKRKMNIVDWLNDTYKNPTVFSSWIETIQINRKHLEYIFNSEYIEGVNRILKELFPTENAAADTTAIKAFIQKENTLFAYSNDLKWGIIGEEQFHQLLDYLFKQLMNEFIKWQRENLHKMAEDEFSDSYALNVKKIMGGNHTREQICFKVKKELYNYLKINLVQYDFN